MTHCINVNHQDVQDLAEELGLHPAIIAAKIAVWQDNQEGENKYSKWPTKEELQQSSLPPKEKIHERQNSVEESNATTFPHIKDVNGNSVVSQTYKTMMNYSTDKEELDNMYQYTQSKEFKAWDAVTDVNGEPMVDFIEDRPVFMNHANEVMEIFPQDRTVNFLTTNSVLENIAKVGLIDEKNNIASDDIKRVVELNDQYKETYDLKHSLLYVAKVGNDNRVIVDRGMLAEINRQITNDSYVSLEMKVDDELTDDSDFEEMGNKEKTFAEKFLDFKRERRTNLFERLKTNENNLARKHTDQEAFDLGVQKQAILHELYGNVATDTKGLVSEVRELTKLITGSEKDMYVSALDSFGTRDINRLEALINAGDRDSLDEAVMLSKFYKNFTALTSDNYVISPIERENLSTEDTNLLASWMTRVNDLDMMLTNELRENMNEFIASRPSVMSMYGAKLSKEEITRITGKDGLKDASVIDMFFMDASNGMFSHNGIIPQIMMLELENSMSRTLATTKHIEEKITKLLPNAEKLLSSLDGGSHKFKAGGGVSFDMFRRKNKAGNKTGEIISRFSDEWDDAEVRQKRSFMNSKNGSDNSEIFAGSFNSIEKTKAIEEAHRSWYKKHAVVINPMAIKELVDYVAEHPILKNMGWEAKEELSTAKDLDVTDVHYNDIIEEYKQKFEAYANDYRCQKQMLLGDVEGELNSLQKLKLSSWEKEHSPIYGFENWNEESLEGDRYSYRSKEGDNVTIYNDFENNVIIPKKMVDEKESGYWDNNYATFEQHPELHEMRNLLSELSEYINTATGERGLLTDKKKLWEILFDNSDAAFVARMHQVWNRIWDSVKEAISIIEGREVTGADLDADRKIVPMVNHQIVGNNSLISKKFSMEKIRLNKLLNENDRLDNYYSIVSLNHLSDNALRLVASYLNIKSNDADTIREEIGKVVKVDDGFIPIGKIIRNSVANDVIEESSTNIPRTLVAYAHLAAEYNARQEVKPVIDSLLSYYKDIKNLKTNNIDTPLKKDGEPIYDGDRINANKQIDSWYNRNVLANHGDKQFGNIGKVYTEDDKVMDRELSNLLIGANEADTENLLKMKNELGRNWYASKSVLALFRAIRLKTLGWNLSSAVSNLMDGWISNELFASQTDLFTHAEWYRASGSIVQKAMVAWNSKEATQLRALMERYDVEFNSRNEFQKQEDKMPLSKLNLLTPYNLSNTKVEYYNQSPLMVSILLHTKIKSDTGEESSVWDAMDADGMLKEGFRSQENIENWENMDGDAYSKFKASVSKAIVLAHGDYAPRRGNVAKEHIVGKGFLMFKTWLPRAVYTRFATEQDDIELGTEGYKGRYRSMTKASAGMHGAVIGGMVAGPFGAIAGYGLGVGLGGINKSKHSFAGINNVNNSVTQHLQETSLYLTIMAKKMAGLPINKLAGRQIIDFDGMQKQLTDRGFSAIDARNMQANLTELTITLSFVAMSMLAKGILYDDKDKKDSARQQIHNLIVNKLMSLAQQSNMYANMPELFNSTVGKPAILKFGIDVGKTAMAAEQFFQGEDILISGDDKGKSRLATTIKKSFLPSPIRNPFQSEMRTEFPTAFALFKQTFGIAKEDHDIKAQRAIEEREEIDAGVDEKQARKDAVRHHPALHHAKPV